MTIDIVPDKARRQRRVRWRPWTCFLALALATFCAVGVRVHAQPAAKEQSVSPGINNSFVSPDLDINRWIANFEGESREIFAQRQAITEAVRLRPGMTVADIGAGTGLFMELFAQKVGPEGKLYAIDIAPKFVEHIRERAAAQGLTHVAAVLGQESTLRFTVRSLAHAIVFKARARAPTSAINCCFCIDDSSSSRLLSDFFRIR